MFGEHWREISVEGHVVADQYVIPHGHGESHRLVVRVADANGKPAAVKGGFKIEHSEHLHAVLRYCVLVAHDCDLREGKRLQLGLDDESMSQRAVGFGGLRSGNELQL